PDGPWQAWGLTHDLPARMPLASAEEQRKGVQIDPRKSELLAARLSGDTVRLWAPSPNHALALERDYKPYHYKVSQVFLEEKGGRLEPASGQAFSNVAAPGDDVEIYVEGKGQEPLTVEREEHERYATLPVLMTLRSQA